MAIRYSGDVEIRLNYVDGKYRATVRAPGFSAKGSLSPREVGLTRKLQPSSPDSYDEAAMAFLQAARTLSKHERRKMLPLDVDAYDRIQIRRTFQAPCPVRNRRH